MIYLKKIGKVLLVIALFITLALGYRVWRAMQTDYSTAQALSSLEINRPEHSQEIPQLPEYVSDVKMTVVPRVYEPPALFANDELEMTYLQIWYEYEVDGQWYRYPSENFDLVGIFGDAGSLDWEAAHKNHMVKIGSKLLICINATNYPDCEFQIRDSLDSEILEPFAAYYEPQYAYLAENARGIGVRSTDTFWPRYYLLLDYASLPEHYELEFVYQFDGDVRRYTLTKDAIAELFQ